MLWSGESIFCKRIGHIKDNPSIVINNLINGKPCNQCHLVKNLPNKVLKVLGF